MIVGEVQLLGGGMLRVHQDERGLCYLIFDKVDGQEFCYVSPWELEEVAQLVRAHHNPRADDA